MNEELQNFYESLTEDTLLKTDEYKQPDLAFAAAVLDRITGLIDCNDPVIEHCQLLNNAGSITGEIHAYAESSNEEILYLFYTDYNSSFDIVSKSNTDCQNFLNRPQGFYRAATRGIYEDYEVGSAEYRALRFIYESTHKYQSVTIVVISNAIIPHLELKRINILSKNVYMNVWDLSRLYANTHTLSDHEIIDIDFSSEEYKNYKIPFLQMESSQYGYKCVLAMFPAKLLYKLYDRYNTNLLYNNVRYFLGLKGDKDHKPNVAMQDTLRTQNEMFLAYNNGLTALAKGIESDTSGARTELSDQSDGDKTFQYITMGTLKKILDFRIINGGQTTAVIYNSKKQSSSNADPSKRVTLNGVFVQVKLIISDEIEKISENITRSSNFQNKMKISDFSVSNKFNTTLESLSRTITCPNGQCDVVHWFYERLRGQYDEYRHSKKTKNDRDLFDSQFPPKQRFSKEEVAKVWMNWFEQPYDAVKGSGTTYATFMKKMVDDLVIPDEEFFKKTVALIIIYRFLCSRPENKNYTNGKATVIAYTMSLLQRYTFGKFNLMNVWEMQGLSDKAKKQLNMLADDVYRMLFEKATEQKNTILSYGKSIPAYNYVKTQSLKFDHRALLDD